MGGSPCLPNRVGSPGEAPLSAPGPSTPPDLSRLVTERDLFLRLLELGAEDDLPRFLDEALGLIVATSGARQGYLALYGEGERASGPAFWIARGCSDDDVRDIRSAVSRGIIAEALATGRTLSTASAVDDPRFQDRRSVQAGRIQAVLCAPVGGEGSTGVLYLQGRAGPGPFSEDDRRTAEVFARHLAPLADRLITRERLVEGADPTRPHRDRLRAEGLVGRSPAFAEMLAQVVLVAPLDVSVLLTGPSGSGKTEVARVIHASGPRATRPFVELNCAALPDNLVESELFGAERGAHSTATRRAEGKVAAAEGGTLFLDEVSELPLASQAKLLQLLQSRLYFRLGGTRPETADVRVLAASNADLAAAVRDKRVREDLYWRLHVLPVRVPALSERREDVPLLAASMLAGAAKRHGLPPLRLSRAAVRAAIDADWPGNVRQLGNAVEAAAIRAAAEGAPEVTPAHLFPGAPPAGPVDEGAAGFHEATRKFQARLLDTTLDETGWNVSEAARRLGLARSHVHDLIRSFGLRRS